MSMIDGVGAIPKVPNDNEEFIGLECVEFMCNKIVRSKVPEILKQKGLGIKTSILNKRGYAFAMFKKLDEEIKELLNAKTDKEALEELGDIMDVFYKITYDHKLNLNQLTEVGKKIEDREGKFQKYLFLDHLFLNDNNEKHSERLKEYKLLKYQMEPTEDKRTKVSIRTIVRDNTPEILRRQGIEAVFVELSYGKFVYALKYKLLMTAKQLLLYKKNNLLPCLAEVFYVFNLFVKERKIAMSDIIDCGKQKRITNGDFYNYIFIDSVFLPKNHKDFDALYEKYTTGGYKHIKKRDTVFDFLKTDLI